MDRVLVRISERLANMRSIPCLRSLCCESAPLLARGASGGRLRHRSRPLVPQAGRGSRHRLQGRRPGQGRACRSSRITATTGSGCGCSTRPGSSQQSGIHDRPGEGRRGELGFKFLLDFHYSDTWADPGKQFMPEAWEGIVARRAGAGGLRVYARHDRAFREAGVLPDMVQIGNEVIDGMLWPDGKLPEHWDHFADLVKAGIRGWKPAAATARARGS